MTISEVAPEDDLITGAIGVIDAAVARVREALAAEGSRVAKLPPTISTLTARGFRAVAQEKLKFQRDALIRELRDAHKTLEQLRAM